MSGCVTVTGPPASICLRKIGTTLPEEPRTLPKRTATKRVSRVEEGQVRGSGFRAIRSDDPDTLNPEPSFSDCTYNSATRLRRPHHARRIHRFVRADHHKRLRFELKRRVGDDLRAEDVVLDRFAGIVLHHRHVLVGGAMEDDLGVMGVEDLCDAAGVADVGDDGAMSAPTQRCRNSRSISKRTFSARSSRISVPGRTASPAGRFPSRCFRRRRSPARLFLR